jgi:uncharacterized membrane protein YhaH (DUF805 family)
MVVESSAGITNLSTLFVLPILLPQLAVSVRRMHDTDHSGWFLLVPIYNLILLCTASTPGSNKHGDL